MQASRLTQLLLISGAVALSVALYLAPHNAPDKPSAPALTRSSPKKSFDFDELLSFQKKNLSAGELQKTESWLSDLKLPSSRVNLDLFDSVAHVWDTKKMFALSAHYYEMKAEKDHAEKSYINAAYRYFDAYKDAIDSSLRVTMADKAISNYTKVITINPKNLDAKSDLGILYAEATPEPMKGIMMLREVVTENPKHENAQMNLGVLSVKSHQYEKALERFNKVLEINPQRNDVYIYIGQTYIQMGDKAKAIENFEKYKKASANLEMIEEVNNYIAELKKE